VLANEVIKYLDLSNGDKVLDGTVGCGGHSRRILDHILPKGSLIGIDKDEQALEIANKTLSDKKYQDKFILEHANFSELETILLENNIEKLNGVLFDLGISSFQIDTAQRGFSIKEDGPLDMRMDLSQNFSALDVVNRYPEKELADVIFKFGEERASRRIARYIVTARKVKRIETTHELARIVVKALRKPGKHSKTHPATRTFQAIRIEVNSELSSIEKALEKVVKFLSPKAKLCVISFHSLEDRMIKLFFRELAKDRESFKILTKKPIVPSDEEIGNNPRSRSAKLRVIEKI
jgi:16S rRNA (cytosine1402-N4)-methyltransferase